VKACVKSAGKIRLDGESIMWEIAGKGERLDIVFPVSHARPRVGPESLGYELGNHHGMEFRFSMHVHGHAHSIIQ
jgi:hypothetical protein